MQNNTNQEIIKIIKQNVLSKIINQPLVIDLINSFFINNLNVSQTAKLLYMHRNSLINKLEQIEKQTSLNIQNFTDAYVMKTLIDFKD